MPKREVSKRSHNIGICIKTAAKTAVFIIHAYLLMFMPVGVMI